ncbi:hypothetical protein BKA82DRAFT_175084 [Pisolithus tinctorius]|uniref:Uncharacterized protein n=1 Tax=Pisolithus tinctorius Marx 270 TaxID=870435 RepID=A0A0C3JZA9_PISTI|nr:hypothetical protein BKA82DRAFT_175084 [Pisolithus tinctorius]KIO14493.1 hypothetical protein M404DRAFT_175084 [Pisolithus tinctorius Marx 270]
MTGGAAAHVGLHRSAGFLTRRLPISSLAAPIILLFCICTYAKRWTLNAEWSPFRTFASCDLRWILLITQDRHKISPLMLSRGLLLILVSQTPSQLSSLRSAVSMARTWWLDLSVMSVDEGARPPPSELSGPLTHIVPPPSPHTSPLACKFFRSRTGKSLFALMPAPSPSPRNR